MPGYDGTGPQGMGPMTGRGLGPCGRGFPRGFGRGFGRGLGYGRQVNLTKDEEKKILKEELKEIDLEKQDIEQRLREFN